MKSSPRSQSKEVRLNKFIAQAGGASRREADRLIQTGQVRVNGETVTTLGMKIDPIKSEVIVQGHKLHADISNTYLMFYKPRDVTSSMSKEDPSSLFPFFKDVAAKGLFHVGRLDRESEGLLLVTNDGDWGNRMLHPRYEVEKEYELVLDAPLEGKDERALRLGIRLADGPFRVDEISVDAGSKVRIVIHDGRNRILRRAFDKLGYEVLRLKRVRYGAFRLGKIKPGEFREISVKHINL